MAVRLAPDGRPGVSGLDDEIDHDAFFALIKIFDLDLFAITGLHLLQQRNRVVIVDEAHALAGLQRIERAEDRGVAKPLGNAARVEAVDAVGPVMVVDYGLDRDMMFMLETLSDWGG
jgi:hypothetical protein